MVDVFVIVSCRETSIIDRWEFNIPIITPYELLIALNSEPWESRIDTSVENILNVKECKSEEFKQDEEER